jgi:hypothetical protein
MKVEHYPNLLIVTRLVKRIDDSSHDIRKWGEHLHPDMEEVFLHGVFVMSVASMEGMLSDVLKYYLQKFPQKINSDFKYSKDDFFVNYFNLLDRTIENHVIQLTYKSFTHYSNKLLEYLAIEWDNFQESIGKYIQEISASRNLLLHNKLIVNDLYLDRAGPVKLSSLKGAKLSIDYEYVVQSLDIIIKFQDGLKQRIARKYKDYTRINAHKRLWEFMFTSPLMIYDEYWRYDDNTDKICAIKKGRHEGGLSSSETILLGFWRAHFNDSHQIPRFNMKTLSKEKLMFFLSMADEFSFH